MQYILILSTSLFLLLCEYVYGVCACFLMSCEWTNVRGGQLWSWFSFFPQDQTQACAAKRLYPLSHLPAYCLPGHCWSFQSCFFVSFCFWQELVMYLVAQISIELVILFTFHILGLTFFGVFAWSLTNSKLLLKSPFKYFREYLLM